MNFYWTGEEVLERLDNKMTQAFNAVLDTSKENDVHMRDAAYIVAIDSVVRAMQFRGWI
jgi:glutamate dehydrogenase/leucine dehydrogenase